MNYVRLLVAALLGMTVVCGSGCGRNKPAATRPAARPAGAGQTPANPAARAPGPGVTVAAAPADEVAALAPKTLPPAGSKAVDARRLAMAQADLNEGLTFLLTQRNRDGGWGFAPGRSHPALTAMALKAFSQHPDYGGDSPVVAKGFECLLKFRQPDGGFYVPEEGNINYVTSVSVMALAAAGNPRHKEVLDKAVAFLRGQQIVPDSRDPKNEVISKDHPYVGGVSYGRHGRPDLSNEGMWISAMHAAGVPGDDPAMQRALAFVKRLQNRTEGTEGQSFVVRGEDDGGFVYAVRRQGATFVPESKAGEGPKGLRSYGSMTYIGFMSMLYASAAKDDPRVVAAYDWIRKYWRLDSNPNMPEAQSREGLYYYYHVFAKALSAWGHDIIPDTRGVKHNWRHELIEMLNRQQKANGSWANTASRWMEKSPVLVTCYSVLALQEALGG